MKRLFSLANNRSILLCKLVLLLSSLGLMIYLLSLLASILLLAYNEKVLFSVPHRTVLVVLFQIPLIISLLIVFLYERTFPNRYLKLNVIIKLFLFQLYLFIPTIVLLNRYNDLPKVYQSFIAALGALLFFIGPFIKVRDKYMFDIIRMIYYSAWIPKSIEVERNHFNENEMSFKRKCVYTEENTLKIFQDNYVKFSNESAIINNYLNKTLYKKTHNKNPLRVLDIGGYTGEFTRKFLTELNLPINNIVLVDPLLSIEQEYIKNVINLTSNIKIQSCLFDEFNPQEEYAFDLIIASHSLYSSFDNGRDKYHEILSRIISLLLPDGLAIIIMGSHMSRAYSLKKEVIKLVLNEDITDSTASDIYRKIITFDSPKKIYNTILSIDNCIDITSFIDSDETINGWISYFARIPKIEDLFFINQIKQMLHAYSVTYYELPLCLLETYKNLNQEHEILLHKTEAILLSQTSSIVFKS